MQQANVPLITLNNGVKMPQLGLGVYQAEDGAETEQAVSVALEAGYRSFDTAKIYGNERSVGKAIRDSGIKRDEVFITTKLWNNDQGDIHTVTAAFEASMERLDLDYIDLYLMHWPMPKADKFVQTWLAMESLYKQKRVKAIGVSNFLPEHLQRLLGESDTVPAVNQVELHPRLQQHDTREYCHKNGIAVESWSPIMKGGELLNDENVKLIAKTHSKSAAQILLRWHIQHGLIVIPKSVTPDRIKENINIFDFELNADDMRKLDGLNKGKRVGPDPRD